MSLPNSSSFDAGPRRFGPPILCYVTDRRSLPVAPPANLFEPLLEKIERAAVAGVDWIQLREKDLPAKQSVSLALDAVNRVSHPSGQAGSHVRIIANDRLDVALASQAGGLHLGEASLPIDEAKRLLLAPHVVPTVARDFLLGVSCHSLEAAKAAAASGANYIFFGPIFPTPSKTAFGLPQGLDRLAEICCAVNIPVLAIGGIMLANVSACLSAGAAGIAAIRLFQESSNLPALISALRRQRS